MSGGEQERIRRSLGDFLQFCEIAADQIVARGREAWDGELTLRLAAEALLRKLGEAVARLPEQFVGEHPDVRWRALKGVRNIVAQQYHQVDYDIIWIALARDLPADARRVRSILDEMDDS